MTNKGTILVGDDTPANLKLLTDATAQSGMSVTRLAGALAICGGGPVLVGWAFDITALKSVLPGWVSMVPNTALAFILTGIALLFPCPSPLKLLSRFPRLCGWLAGLIGLLTLIEYAFGWNPGFDQWLFREPVAPAGMLYPGRMAPDAALCFALLAAGMEIAHHSRRRTGMFVVSAILGLLVTIVACFEILSYFTQDLRIHGWSGLTMMALPTAILFAALSAAIVLGAWRDTLGLRLTQFTSHLWWMSGCVGVLAIAFALSAQSINQANRANELRHQSFLLADALRQSSDDLTRMMRTYVMTGDPVYKQHYQDILDIRNGKKPRPEGYWKIYWDLVLPGGPAPHTDGRQAISLLELMRQAGFAEEEFRKLGEAAANSDGLASLEIAAMKLVESTGPNAGADRAKARMMLFDDHYHQAKAAIMKPIDEVYVLLDQRTLATVHTAENFASIFRYIFAAFGLGLMFMLWRTYLALCDILGGSVDEVRAHITKIGSGDFSSIIKVQDSRKNSVLGWLSATQANLNDIARERERAEKELRDSEERHRQLFEDALDGICLVDAQTEMILDCNPALLKLVGRERHEVVGQSQRILHPPSEVIGELTSSFEQHHEEKAGQTLEAPIITKAGEVQMAEIRANMHEVQGRKIMVGIFRNISERKRAEAELKDIHKQLVEASRRGGMAEIATNVLHNVGNVLNSVNISTGLIVESVKKSRASSLARVVILLREHAHDVGEFITNDFRGKHAPAHLAQLSEHLLADQAAIVSELDSLQRNVEHIKEIVAMQQNYATFGGVKELVNVVDLVEDSLRLNESALGRHDVEVIRQFEQVRPMNVEKHKFLQVMVNLLRNAKHACQDSARADKRLTVRVANGEGRIRISVMDNGIGIPPENLTRIFNHGFTTRKGGHGFGLHSGALAAKEMGGSLTVLSDGPGQGAAFTLELPGPTRENSHE
jgi:PAS domain S-box-containing protein